MGHDGLDFSAIRGTEVLAPNSGIARIGYDEDGWGRYVSVWGKRFITHVCHLTAPLIKEGQYVSRGDLIAASGNTGNCDGDHLHIAVEPRSNADRNNGFKGRIDPYPLLFGEDPVKSIWGWHGGNSAPISADEQHALDISPLGMLVFLAANSGNSEAYTPQVIKRLHEQHPACEFFMRSYLHPPSLGPGFNYEQVLPAYFDQCCRDIEAYLAVLGSDKPLHVQIFNEQNMPRWALWNGYGEGFGDSYNDMLVFNHWFSRGYRLLKLRFGEAIKVDFSPLAIGNYDVYTGNSSHQNVSYYMHGPEAAKPAASEADIQAAIKSGPCYEALSLADGYLAHCYLHWGEAAWKDTFYGLRFIKYAKFFPKPMDIWITEAGIPRAGEWHAWTLSAIKNWLSFIRSCHDPERFYVRGAALWLLGNNPEWGGIWENRRGDIAEICKLLPDGQQEEPLPPVPPPAAGFSDLDRERCQSLSLQVTGMKKACLKAGYWDLGVETPSSTDHYLLALAWDPAAQRTLRVKIFMPTWQIVAEEEVVL